MNYKEFRPCLALSGLVHHYWIYEKGHKEALFERDSIFPEAWPTLGFISGDPISFDSPTFLPKDRILLAVGLRNPVSLSIPGKSRIVGIQFSPSGLPGLLGVRAQEVTGLAPYEPPWLRTLSQAIAFCPEAIIPSILDTELFKRLPTKDTLIQWKSVEETLIRSLGSTNMDSLVRNFGKSRRQLERALLEGTGFSPGDWRSAYRAQMARYLLFLTPRIKTVDAALLLGYADQAHMSRSFKTWTGLCPRDYRIQCQAVANQFSAKDFPCTFPYRDMPH